MAFLGRGGGWMKNKTKEKREKTPWWRPNQRAHAGHGCDGSRLPGSSRCHTHTHTKETPQKQWGGHWPAGLHDEIHDTTSCGAEPKWKWRARCCAYRWSRADRARHNTLHHTAQLSEPTERRMDTDLFVRSRRPAPCFPSVIGRARPSRCTWKFFGAGAGRSSPDRTNMKQLRSDRLSRQPDITNNSSLIPSKKWHLQLGAVAVERGRTSPRSLTLTRRTPAVQLETTACNHSRALAGACSC